MSLHPSQPEPVSRLGPFGLCVLYGFSIFSMAFVGTIVPVAAQFAQRLGVEGAVVGGAIALFSIPSALLALFSGGLVEKLGTRNAIAGGGILVLFGDAAAYFARSIAMLDAACLIAGIGFMIIITAAPAFIVQTSTGAFRTRAMSIWSTYAPAGFSAGLLMAAPFASRIDWYDVSIVHGCVIAVLLFSVMALPKDDASPMPAGTVAPSLFRLTTLLSLFADAGLIRLGLAFAIMNGLAYGTGLVATPYLSEAHHISIGRAATAVAVAKILAMIAAGLGMGELMTRRDPRLLFAAAIATGVLAQCALFWPASGFWLAASGLGIWLLAYGCLASICMALLPVFLRKTGHPALVSGLFSQLTSIFSFLGARVYVSIDGWGNFLTVMFLGVAIAALLMPLFDPRSAGGRASRELAVKV
jgi:MFS family permease